MTGTHNRADRPHALPIYSVREKSEAMRLVVMACRLGTDHEYYLPFTGKFEHLQAASNIFADLHRHGKPSRALGDYYGQG